MAAASILPASLPRSDDRPTYTSSEQLWLMYMDMVMILKRLMYMDMVMILKRYIHAERAGLWEEYLAELENMLLYLVAAGRRCDDRPAYTSSEHLKGIQDGQIIGRQTEALSNGV